MIVLLVPDSVFVFRLAKVPEHGINVVVNGRKVRFRHQRRAAESYCGL